MMNIYKTPYTFAKTVYKKIATDRFPAALLVGSMALGASGCAVMGTETAATRKSDYDLSELSLGDAAHWSQDASIDRGQPKRPFIADNKAALESVNCGGNGTAQGDVWSVESSVVYPSSMMIGVGGSGDEQPIGGTCVVVAEGLSEQQRQNAVDELQANGETIR